MNTFPVDSRTTIEVAPGIFIPASRVDEFEMALDTHPAVAQAVFDMHTCVVEVAPKIEVARQDVEAWVERMNNPVFMAAMDCLMDRLNSDDLSDVTITLNLTPAGRAVVQRDLQLHSVANFALSFGKSN